MRPALAVLLALLVLPTAEACSLSRAPSGPGYIWLHDAEGTLLRTIEVDDQSLTAECGLGNVVGLTSRHLAWHDRGRLHLLDLATDEVTTRALPDGGQVRLTAHGLLVQHWTWDGTTSNDTWTLHRWDGSSALLPLPRAWAYFVWHDGEHAVVQTRESARANVTTAVYDLADGRLVNGPLPVETVAGGPDWHVVSNGTRLVLHREDAAAAEAEGRYGAQITELGVWTEGWDEATQEPRLAFTPWGGAASGELALQGGLIAATPTHLVTGTFALEWRSDPFGLFAPAPVGLSIGLLLLALAAARRR